MALRSPRGPSWRTAWWIGKDTSAPYVAVSTVLPRTGKRKKGHRAMCNFISINVKKWDDYIVCLKTLAMATFQKHSSVSRFAFVPEVSHFAVLICTMVQSRELNRETIYSLSHVNPPKCQGSTPVLVNCICTCSDTLYLHRLPADAFIIPLRFLPTCMFSSAGWTLKGKRRWYWCAVFCCGSRWLGRM